VLIKREFLCFKEMKRFFLLYYSEMLHVKVDLCTLEHESYLASQDMCKQRAKAEVKDTNETVFEALIIESRCR
jgi:hypothetical protein